MSLDVYLTKKMPTEVYNGNVTHNLVPMAKKAGLYELLWRPDEMKPPITTARELIKPLGDGLDKLLSNREYYEKFNPENGWGSFDGLVTFIREYRTACEDNPDAKVSVWR